MPVLVVAEVQGQTKEKYDRLIDVLRPALLQATGFIAHGAGPAGETWITFEVWESQAEATQFFARYVHPNLPEGVKPKRTIVELHNLMLGERTMKIDDALGRAHAHLP